MPVNNNTYMLLEERRTIARINKDYLRDLIDSRWEYLSPYQRKRFYYWMLFEVTKERVKKRAAVIVSALRGVCDRVGSAWRDMLSLCDRADCGRVPTVEQLYSMANDKERIEFFIIAAQVMRRRRRREYLRGVIVSACVRAWCDLCGVIVPTAGGLVNSLAVLFLIVTMAGW